MSEKWLPVIGYEDHYSVSNLGQIKRNNTGRILRLAMRNGYFSVSLCKNNIKKMHTVHSMVAKAFIGPVPKKHEINHKDGIKTNNVPSNLEYVTDKENTNHAIREGLTPVGENSTSSKLTETDVFIILVAVENGVAQRKLAKVFSVSKYCIYNIVSGKGWKHLKREIACQAK